MALTCQVWLYKDENDGFPTLSVERAIKNDKGDLVMFEAIYSSSSYGTKDLPKIFSYTLEQCVRFFKTYGRNSPTVNDFINNSRLDMVQKILHEAYVDDISIHLLAGSIFNYFYSAYTESE